MIQPDRWPLPNVWLGVSCEDRDALRRVEHLRATPATVRFLSLEPLLEDLGTLNLTGIHWVIAGGESGPGARPCNVEWIRSIVAQCEAARVSCFVKQLGSVPAVPGDTPCTHPDFRALEFGLKSRKGADPSEWPADLRVREMPGEKP